MRAASGGVATHTIPAEARRAASAAISGAPVNPRAPPITSTAPAVYLVSPGRLPAAVRPSASTAAVATSACGGMPISATTTRPDAAPARLDGGAELAAVEAHGHLGRHRAAGDHAGRGVDPRRHVQRDDRPAGPAVAAITRAASGLGAPVKPGAEQRVHDHVGALQAGPAHAGRACAPRAARRCRGFGARRRAARPDRRRAGTRPPTRRRAGGGRPRIRRRRCCRPPQTTAALLPAKRAMISRAAARPARSMSTAPGMPISAIAPASAARISPASYSGRVRIMPRRRRQRPPPSPSSASC